MDIYTCVNHNGDPVLKVKRDACRAAIHFHFQSNFFYTYFIFILPSWPESNLKCRQLCIHGVPKYSKLIQLIYIRNACRGFIYNAATNYTLIGLFIPSRQPNVRFRKEIKQKKQDIYIVTILSDIHAHSLNQTNITESRGTKRACLTRVFFVFFMYTAYIFLKPEVGGLGDPVRIDGGRGGWWPCGDEAHDENYIVTILVNDYTSTVPPVLSRERERERGTSKQTKTRLHV